MKYRVKVQKYRSGKTRYIPQKKVWYGWSWIPTFYMGDVYFLYHDTIDKAMSAIQKHIGTLKDGPPEYFTYVEGQA